MRLLDGVSNVDLFLFRIKEFPEYLREVVLWPFYAAFVCLISCYAVWCMLHYIFNIFTA